MPADLRPHRRLDPHSVPALTLAEIMAKAKALGPVPSATLPYLSKGEWALVASIIHDVHRMAEFRAAADGVEIAHVS
jgi:hypothetical protein